MSMTNREKTIFNNLKQLSMDGEKIGNSRHAAAVYKKGIIYGMGTNSSRSDPMQRRYSDHPLKTCIHAEMLAIKRASAELRTVDLSAYAIIVVRTKDDNGKTVLGNSKPCKACQKAIEEYNIKKLIYSTNGGYKVEKEFNL